MVKKSNILICCNKVNFHSVHWGINPPHPSFLPGTPLYQQNVQASPFLGNAPLYWFFVIPPPTSPPPKKKSPVKFEVLPSPPPFWKSGWRFNPPPPLPPSRKREGVHTIILMYTDYWKGKWSTKINYKLDIPKFHIFIIEVIQIVMNCIININVRP